MTNRKLSMDECVVILDNIANKMSVEKALEGLDVKAVESLAYQIGYRFGLEDNRTIAAYRILEKMEKNN